MSLAPDKSDIDESGKCFPLFAFRAPRPARVGPSPGALAMLADEVTWERFDVYTELFVYVRALDVDTNCCLRGSPFGVPILLLYSPSLLLLLLNFCT